MSVDADPHNAIAMPEDLRVGVPTLDRQHLELDRLLRELEAGLQGGAASLELADRIQVLQALAEEHYETEEAVMAAYAYPHLGPHHAEHEALLERIHSEFQVFLAPNPPLIQGFIQDIRQVFHQHVRRVDQDYATYLRDHVGYRPLA